MRKVPIPGPEAIRQEHKRLVKAHVEHLTKTRPDLKPSTVYTYAKRAAAAGKWPPGYFRIPPIELVDVTTQPPPPLYDNDALCGSQGHPEVPDIVPEEVATEYMALPYAPPLFSYQDANSNPVAELASRELCRRRLLPFIKRFRPNYTAGWFHADICRRVERFIERVERKESPRLLLMAPPRSGKSEILSRNTPAWIIGKHPEWELIAASYAGALTMTFSRYIRDLLRDPAYHALYPTTKLDPSSQSVEAWNTTRGGMYAAVGQGGPITGKGAHVFLVDDIVKDHEAAQSLSQRESTWAWWTSTAYTRLAPGGGVLALMTNWHADDWAGRIQETMTLGGEVYEVIKYPAINDYGDEYILPDDSIIQIADKEPVPQGALMTRPKNTAIHPERYDTQHMLRIKNNLEMSGQKAVWNALYQQNPVPDEGSFFQKDMFRYYSTPPARRDMYIYQAWDFAISTGKENDYTVGITIGVDHRDAVYVLDMRRFRSGDGIEIAQTILEYSIEWGTNAIGVEDGQIWKAIESQFLKACEEHPSRHFPSYEPLKPLTDKKVRADPLRGRMQAGKVFFDKEAHYFSVMQNELLHFPNAKHDDVCFSAGTKIFMADGSSRNIEDVVVGDLVHTPRGAKRVLCAGKTSDNATVFDLDGRLVGTGNHPIWTENAGWIPLQFLTDSDTLQGIESQLQRGLSWQESTSKKSPTAILSCLTGRCIGVTRSLLARISGSTLQGREKCCTGLFGRFITGLYRRATTYITRTGTRSTTRLPTWSASPPSVITKPIPPSDQSADALLPSLSTSQKSDRLLRSGIDRLKVWSGMLRTAKRAGRTESNRPLHAPNAEQSSSRSLRTPSSVGSPAKTETGTKRIQVMKQPRELAEKQPVYNLTVVDAHCYYANGILVHNCDSLAWAVRLTLTRTPPREPKQPQQKSWRDKLKAHLVGARGGGTHMSA